jgi:hypothetical protein
MARQIRNAPIFQRLFQLVSFTLFKKHIESQYERAENLEAKNRANAP